MNHQDQISSFIDNELSHEAEQEFLISLAASEALRRSFRSELEMKNILHKDEARPPRELRAAVLGAVGIPAAAESSSVGFRSALSRAFLSVRTSILSVVVIGSVGVGYMLHDAIRPSTPSMGRVGTTQQMAVPSNAIQSIVPEVSQAKQPASSGTSSSNIVTLHKSRTAQIRTTTNSVEPNAQSNEPVTTVPRDMDMQPVYHTNPSK